MVTNDSNENGLRLQEIVLSSHEDKTIKNTKELKKSTSLLVYFAVITINLTSITFGGALVWMSPITEYLLSTDSDKNPIGRPITTLEISLLGSLVPIGTVVGPILLEKVFKKFGVKRSLNIINILIAAGLLGLAFSSHISLYYGFIFTVGVLLGATCVGLPVYIGDITEDHNRAKMTCFIGLFIPVGNLYGYILGTLFSIRIFIILMAVPSFISAILTQLFLPESPIYLIQKENRNAAVKNLRKLLGKHSESPEKVADKIIYTNLNKIGKASFKSLWSDKATRKGFIISCTLMMLSNATGIPPIMAYLEPIFKEAGAVVSGSFYAIVVGLVQIFCYLTASILVERIGRRPLLLSSAATNIFPLFTLGLYFYLIQTESMLVQNLKWFPIVGIITLTISSAVGICSVAMAYMNEVFVSNLKATAISLIYVISGILTCTLVFLFPIFMDTIGLSWCFWMFCLLNVKGFFFIYFCVPETSGKSISEIRYVLSK